jgi:hypothetical protein
MTTLPQRFANVRVAVAFLGQAGAAGWWTSSFLSPTGLAVAEYNFPRAARYAAVSATVAGAKRIHDERIGKRRCVHLFRLPLANEMLVQQALKNNGCELLSAMPTRSEQAMEILEAEGRELISVDAGPVQVGSVHDAFTESGLQELAKHYLAAFRQDLQCLPYFADAKR